ncbi:hypothetical protein LC085_07875 [Bacillus tianshenii]|uniref:ABC transporter permease n=1 Tax=Sutcliffiella tianshenii TaxID=1463404 RepID=UPI001CD5C0B9|nr:hypothetical protein [Bacillus tianshenii]MCA1319830.1 hypothetical protein [Bacillus tianshenii]
MITYIRHLQLELTFIFKNWLFLIAPLLYLVSIYIWFTFQGPYQAAQPILQRTNEFLAVGHTVSLGVMFLASVLSIRREKQTVMLDWTNSLPTSYRGIILAKFSAINLYSLIYTIIFLVSFIVMGMVQDEQLDFLVDHGSVLALQSQVSYLVSIALGMFLAAMIPNRIVYIITFCAWMFGTFFMEGFIIQRYHLYYLKTFHLSQFFLAQYLSEGWAFDMAQKEALRSRVFVVFFGLLLLSLTVWRAGTNRLSSKKRSAAFSVFIILGVTIASAAPYTSLWIEKVKKSEKLFHYAVNQENLEESNIDFTSFLKTENYSLDVKRVGDSAIRVDSEIIIDSLKENHLTFTLYPTFEIEAIKWNGKELDYQRENSNVTLENLEISPSNTLSVTYQGTMNEWGYSYSDEKNFAFLQDDNMFLPSYIAWYPIIGEIPVYEKYVNGSAENLFTNYYHRSAELSQNIPKTNFSVTLVGFEQPIFGTFEESSRQPDGSIRITSNTTPGLTLFSQAGLVEKELSFGTSMISMEKHMEQIEGELAELEGVLPYLNSWLTISNSYKEKFVYLPSLEYTGSENYYINIIDDTFFVDERSRQYVLSYGPDYDSDYLFLDVKAQFITDLLFDFYPQSPYAISNDFTIYHGMIQAYLFVAFKEHYQYNWEDFRSFNGTNYWNLASLGYLEYEEGNNTLKKLNNRLSQEELAPEEEIVYLVAKEWENGNKEEVKQFLREVYEDMQASPTPGYKYYDWKIKWKKIFMNE